MAKFSPGGREIHKHLDPGRCDILEVITVTIYHVAQRYWISTLHTKADMSEYRHSKTFLLCVLEGIRYLEHGLTKRNSLLCY